MVQGVGERGPAGRQNDVERCGANPRAAARGAKRAAQPLSGAAEQRAGSNSRPASRQRSPHQHGSPPAGWARPSGWLPCTLPWCWRRPGWAGRPPRPSTSCARPPGQHEPGPAAPASCGTMAQRGAGWIRQAGGRVGSEWGAGRRGGRRGEDGQAAGESSYCRQRVVGGGPGQQPPLVHKCEGRGSSLEQHGRRPPGSAPRASGRAACGSLSGIGRRREVPPHLLRPSRSVVAGTMLLASCSAGRAGAIAPTCGAAC